MLQPPPADLDLARTKVTANGAFSVSVAPEAGEATQGPLHNWVVTVKTPQGAAVDGATIAIDGGMPQHGHGLPTSPQMTKALGDGRYLVEGVRFNMGGWWEFKLVIDAGGVRDAVTFNLVL
ncbi:MAG TPA: FixH family protein [Rhizobiaceae bacterium]|nr:FixH family protein [Rhizobiaceae bacterium]